MRRTDYDVVVVGGSVAGLHAAEHMARAGMRVGVFERRPRLGEPERTWIVTPQIAPLLGEEPARAVVHRTGVMEMFAGGARRRVRLEPADLIVERAELIPYLARRAEAAGAEVRVQAGVSELRPLDGAFELTLQAAGGTATRIHASHVLGADGVRSSVARAMGARPQNAVPIVQARVHLPDGYDPDVTQVWFERGRTRFFYWLIPDSAETGVLGLVADDAGPARQLLDDFMRERSLEPIAYQGAMIPLHQPARRIDWSFGAGRVLLVGDAAAHVKVTTVGGVVSGLWGAQAAARALVEGIGYRRALRALHRELYLHDFMRWGLDRFDNGAYERLLHVLTPPLQRLLGRRNRDSMAGAAWKLLALQPRLLPLGVRSLLFPYDQPEPAPHSRMLRTVEAAD